MILFERDLFMLNDLFLEMINYFAGDAKRIQHLVKVHSFAKLIGDVEASSIGDTFPLKRAVKGRCGDFRSKAKKILPDLDCGSLSV